MEKKRNAGAGAICVHQKKQRNVFFLFFDFELCDLPIAICVNDKKKMCIKSSLHSFPPKRFHFDRYIYVPFNRLQENQHETAQHTSSNSYGVNRNNVSLEIKIVEAVAATIDSDISPLYSYE